MVLGGRYELRRLLGRGGTAEVWRGFDRRLGRTVAVKVLRQGRPVRFEREARTVAKLAHPSIVAVHDAGSDQGLRYLVMELVDGESLAQRLDGGPLPIAEVVRVGVRVCAALEVAAAAGVVHRDVKPGNILLTGDGEVKVCDFGLARAVGSAGSAGMSGTSGYMAPEQVTGDVVDSRTDLYGLGCVLYAMVTGHPPFRGDSPWEHLEETPVPVPELRDGVPERLDSLIRRLTARYPADRPSTPGEVRAALERVGDGLEGTDDAASPQRRSGRRSWIRPVLVATGSALAVAVGCVLIMAEGPGGPGSRESGARESGAREPGAPQFGAREPGPAESGSRFAPATTSPASPVRPTVIVVESKRPVVPQTAPADCRPGREQRIDDDARPGREGCSDAAASAREGRRGGG
ncbi:hypothetical protein ACTI_69730 [Actinoplanes sp. OR16]|uniref:serine/threonine-protein kinase n=1 Tax=Actinoplanes sp. OR16 TaxID=946334 RepID=UPI000F6C37F4|nr:serine/threonine-protein kinase [Actinoplanes sp. OR16]BBH70288.1 hypothetical protein ACTI_69730 [Actinoplanes sp. OR16]